MKPTSILVNEHCLIEQVLNCLEEMVERCTSRRVLEHKPAREAIGFFRGFVERCHYGKEESQLLPTMQSMGVSPQGCWGCSMLQRRDEGRRLVAAMETTVDGAAAGDTRALEEFAEYARAYIDLLLDYIAKQEDCLFPMIVQSLPEAEKKRLTEALDTVDEESEQDFACETYVDLANRLADHFEVPRAMFIEPAESDSSRRKPK